MLPFEASLSSINRNSLLNSASFYESFDNILRVNQDLDKNLDNEMLEENFDKNSFFSDFNSADSKFIPLDIYKTQFVRREFNYEIKKFLGNSRLRIVERNNGIMFSEITASMKEKFKQVKKFLEELECKVVIIHRSSLNGVKFFIAMRTTKGFYFFYKCKNYLSDLWEVIFVFPRGISIEEKTGGLRIIEDIERQRFQLNSLFFNFEESKSLSSDAKKIDKIEILNICKITRRNFECLRIKGTLPIFRKSEIFFNVPKDENQNIIFMNDVLLRYPKNYPGNNCYSKELENLVSVIQKNKIYFSFEICDIDIIKNQDHYPSLAFESFEQNENFLFSYSEFLRKICFLVHEERLEKIFLDEYFSLLSKLRREQKCDEKLCSRNDFKKKLYVTKIILLKRGFKLDSKKKLEDIEKLYNKKNSSELRIDRTINDWENSNFLFINAIDLTFSKAWKFLIELLKKKKE